MGILIKRNSLVFSLKSFIKSISIALNKLRNVLSSFVLNRKFDLQFSAQSIYLSEFLNQKFDPIERRIFIINQAVLFPTYIYKKTETPTQQAYIYKKTETPTNQIYLGIKIPLGVEYQIILPTALASLQNDSFFIASIKRYSLPDKIFQILVL